MIVMKRLANKPQRPEHWHYVLIEPEHWERYKQHVPTIDCCFTASSSMLIVFDREEAQEFTLADENEQRILTETLPPELRLLYAIDLHAHWTAICEQEGIPL